MKNQETPKVNRKNWNEIMERELGKGYSFIKKKCFVCGSLSHLIRDCDFYEKKMAREAELKKQRVLLILVGQISKQPVPTSNSNSFSPIRPHVNKFNQRSHFSKSHSLVRRPIVRNTARMTYSNAIKGNWGTTVKTSAGSSTQEHGGQRSVTFGGSKGYITSKGRIRHKVLFTESECLVVSPDFKMPDANQILLKVPRQHNMYNFDMKTPSLTKIYACLIAKATSDESKLWHRRLDMLKKFDLTSVKTAITPMETKMALIKDEEADEVDVHLYRSMIGLWYPRESYFDLKAFSDSDYAGTNLDRKSTTGGC
ncbi:ribonuclease H-like domain-containing protein, partial [Tanacetum coccineum]